MIDGAKFEFFCSFFFPETDIEPLNTQCELPFIKTTEPFYKRTRKCRMHPFVLKLPLTSLRDVLNYWH